MPASVLLLFLLLCLFLHLIKSYWTQKQYFGILSVLYLSSLSILFLMFSYLVQSLNVTDSERHICCCYIYVVGNIPSVLVCFEGFHSFICLFFNADAFVWKLFFETCKDSSLKHFLTPEIAIT